MAAKLFNKFVAAPVKGLNHSQNLVAGSEEYAAQLDYFLCRPWGLEPIGQLTSQPVPPATPYHFVPHDAASAGIVYVATPTQLYRATSALVYTLVGPAYASPQPYLFSSLSFTTAAGWFSLFFPGTGTGLTIDPAEAVAASGITGPTDVKMGAAYRQRLYMLADTSLGFWYLAADAVTGAATFYNAGSIFNRGGQASCIGTISIDGGNGPEDYLALLSTGGELAIFSGADPAATDWRVVGVYDVPLPAYLPAVNPNLMAGVGGDLYVLTRRGILSSLSLIRGRPLDECLQLTATISPMFDYGFSQPGSFIRPQVGIRYLLGQSLLFLHKLYGDDTFVMETRTGGWSCIPGSFYEGATSYTEIVSPLTYFGWFLISAGGVYKAFQSACLSGVTYRIDTLYSRWGNLAPQQIRGFRPYVYSGLRFAYQAGAATELTNNYNLVSLGATNQWTAAGNFFNAWTPASAFLASYWQTVANSGGTLTSLSWQSSTPPANTTFRFLGWDLQTTEQTIGGP